MILTAQEAYNLARDKNAIEKFIEKMDLSIEAAANSGKFATQEYISWSVTETAVQQITGIYRDRGFAVEYEDRSEEANSYISCDNYSERLIKIGWDRLGRDVKK